MRSVHYTLVLVLLLAVPACDGGPGSAPTKEEVTPDFGPTAAYNRRLIFLGPGSPLPTAAVFDFVALSDSIGIRRGVRARVVDGAGWRGLMDEGWEMEPMREPWRLVPHGPLTLLVGEAGELGALIHRDSATSTRLELGAALAEHSPDVATQLVLWSARLTLDGQRVPGVLLDAQLGRAVNPELAARDTVAPDTAAADTAGPAAPASELAEPETAAPDSVPPPTPIATPGAEALLLNEDGYYAVLATASTGSLAWVHTAGTDDVQAGARLEPAGWSTDDDVGTRVPTSWAIVSATGQLTGELTAESTDSIVLDVGAEAAAMAYALVSGWIEDRGARRDVFGLVRQVW